MSTRLVAVVGAGVAGLAAAHELERRGHAVIVLEARGRIGGRVLTRHARSLSAPVELGAEFVHGDAPETMRLAHEQRLRVARIAGEMLLAQHGRLQRGDFEGPVNRVLGRIDSRRRDESFASFLARHPGGPTAARARATAADFVQGYHAADLAAIGVHSIAPDPGDSATETATHASRVVDGYDMVPRMLARGLASRIRLRTAVMGIDWRRHRVQLTVRSGSRRRSITAHAAVVTVPVGVLKSLPGSASHLPIRPPLPRLERALAGLAMGSVTKLVFAFDELPWLGARGAPKGAALDRLAFLRTPGGRFNVWWSAQPLAAPLAVAWSGGPPAISLAREQRSARRTIAIGELAEHLGMPRRRLEARVRRVWQHDWERDPWALGAYSYARVGGSGAGAMLARPFASTLFFAGEATDAASGTVEGALASGLRAARQVDAALRRS